MLCNHGATPELIHVPGFYEPFNAISHLVATIIFIGLGILLIRHARGERQRIAFASVYAFACIFMLSMSGVYHMLVVDGTASAVMRRLDHGAIFILIAGTFTAVHGIVFRGWIRWFPLIVVWAVTIASVTLKTVFFNSVPPGVGTALYVVLGWGVGLVAIPIYRQHGAKYLAPLFYGGMAYSIGAICHALPWLIVIPRVIHAHEVWHLAVMAGAGLHWWFIWNVIRDEKQSLHRPVIVSA
ncbi:MAG: hemolysin III family protein [Planctomycetota bacterium]